MPNRAVVLARNWAIRAARRGVGIAGIGFALYNQYRLGRAAIRAIEREVRPVVEGARRAGVRSRWDRLANVPPGPDKIVTEPRVVPSEADTDTYQPAAMDNAGQWDNKRYRNGRRKTRMAVTQAVQRANINPLRYYFKGLRAFDDYGNFPLGKDTSIDQTAYYLQSLYFLSLNSCKQLSTGAVPLRRFCMHYLNGVVGTMKCNGQTYQGTASPYLQWFAHDPDPSNYEYIMGSQGFWRWSRLMMNIWGAKNKVVRVKVEIVKAKDETNDPFYYASGDSLTTPTAFPDQLKQEIQERYRGDWVNPLAKHSDRTVSKWVTLKTYKWEFGATSTTDNDTDPSVKTVDIFNRWDRIVRFDRSVKLAAALDNEVTADFVDVTKNVMDGDQNDVTHVHPNVSDHVFAVISATCYHQNSDAFSNLVDASFDLRFEAGWEKVE